MTTRALGPEDRSHVEPVVFLAAGRLLPTNVRLLAALHDLGLEAEWLPPKSLGPEVRARDTVVARLDVLETLDGVEPGIWQLRRLENAGVRVLNPASALLASHDKLATALHLARAGIPHPRTAQAGSGGIGMAMALPVVAKPRFGSWGRDVYLCRNPRELGRCLHRLRDRAWFRRQGALVQELVPPMGRDLRLVVAGSEVVGAVERIAAPGEWRTNVALGGRRQPIQPPAGACELAVRAAAAVGGDLVGIDLLPLRTGGYVVLEINGAVDFTDEYSLDGRDVFEEAVKRIVVRHADATLAAVSS